MLISFSELFHKYELNIKGVVHCGAHYGEEVEEYRARGINKIVLIEPMESSFRILKDKYRDDPNIIIFNCAVGDVSGIVTMNTETANQGQSSSLLEMGEHRKFYPEIVYNGTERVEVRRLEDLPIQWSDYNFLSMDCQGYEGYILKGAAKVLKHFDYIYSEVNVGELYIGCTKIEEMDSILSDYDRVETKMTGQKWGDSFWLRVKQTNAQKVPVQFRPHQKLAYPKDIILTFEEWYYQNYPEIKGRTYLPIFWTSYMVNNNFGKDAAAMQELYDFIQTLDKKKRYYSIYQYDDGIPFDLKEFDILFFAPCGNRADVIIPLLHTPHAFTEYTGERDITASFIGRETHESRKRILKELYGKENYYVTTANHSISEYCNILQRSVFSLCPRGYGNNSFRVSESVHCGAIPVYISDEFSLPDYFDFLEFGVLIHIEQIGDLKNILEAIPQAEILKKQKALLKAKKYYTYEHTLEFITKYIQDGN